MRDSYSYIISLSRLVSNLSLTRDPETEEIVYTVVTGHDRAEKAGIPLEEARRITSINSVHSFQAAQDAADRRAEGRQE